MTPAMTKIEQIARALEDNIKAALPDGAVVDYRYAARAALEAMREPTEAMKKAIRQQEITIEHYHGSGHHRSFPTLGSGPLQAWDDMISAALNEKEQG